MTRSRWGQLGMSVGKMALVMSLLLALLTLAGAVGEARARIRHNTNRIEEMSRDMKALLRGQARIEGKLESGNE